MRMNAETMAKPMPHARVFLDGVEQRFVIVADEERGYIVRLKTDARGQFIRRAWGPPNEVAKERLRGRVEIKVMEQRQSDG